MIPSAKLNIVQRALNRAGRPLGIVPFPVTWEREQRDSSTRDETFESIFRENYWGSRESVSGPGSELARTETYRQALVRFLRHQGISSLFDAPCGDLNWMSEVLSQVNVHYVGGDISDAVLQVARARYPDLDLRHFDICADIFPEGEVWHCRDALLHLSFDDVWAALRNAAQANVRFALMSTYRARFLKNLDIRTGGWRFLDLERPPFNLAPPVEYLPDSAWGEFPRAVGVWPSEAIRKAVTRHYGH